MRRLIDANALRERMFSYYGCVNENSSKEYYKGEPLMNYEVADMIEACIDNAPTVDAVEVVHGRWLYDSGSGKYFCSACDEYAISFKKDTLYGGDLYEVCLSDYCPNCGADMRGTEE